MSRWPHRFAIFLSCATLFLVFVGGLVTSTSSGLSVPDWPLSYGRLMPPMIGGVFYEHGHRMVAATVGFLTICLAILVTLKEPRSWVKKAAWGALGLVILQGVLGGLTVLFRLPKPISIAHACLAQTFLSLVVSLAVWTSDRWKQNDLPRIEQSNVLPLHHLTAGLFGALYVQLILGAVVRHTGWGITLHIADAIVVFTLAVWIFTRNFLSRTESPALFKFSAAIMSVIFIQIGLGIGTYLILGHEFDVIPNPFWTVIVITSHVMTGALTLALSVVLALLAYRSRPDHSTPLKTRMSDYFELTKPGISFMAGISALAGFVMGSHGTINFLQLLHTGLGTLLVASGACTLNMVIERDIDATMNRTKKRPIPAGRLNPGEALFMGVMMGAVGIIYLALKVNVLTSVISATTLSIYLYIYTPLKKVTWLCTAAGAVAGALPPVMGWTAATGGLGQEAWILFGILFFWQFPHFFSLAWLYKEDYSRAGLHMLPVDPQTLGGTAEGRNAGLSMLINSLLLFVISVLPTFIALSGKIYFVTAVGLGVWMTTTSLLFLLERNRLRARQLFFASILYVPILLVAMVLNK